MNESKVLWLTFNFFTLMILAIDVGFLHRKSISTKEDWKSTGVTVAIAFVFNVFVFFYLRKDTGLKALLLDDQ